MVERLQTATFTVLDSDQHPICCGFFVSSCGVALMAAHNSNDWLRKAARRRYVLAQDFVGSLFELDVVSMDDSLDFTVLRLPLLPRVVGGYLRLPPPMSLVATKVSGAPVHVVHGNISLTSRQAAVFGQSMGNIVALDDTFIHYDIATIGGHSGAALLLRGNDVIGMHVSGVNDVDDSLSAQSPSTHGDALRLDLRAVHEAVALARRH